jgi:hypothetical protein
VYQERTVIGEGIFSRETVLYLEVLAGGVPVEDLELNELTLLEVVLQHQLPVPHRVQGVLRHK